MMVVNHVGVALLAPELQDRGLLGGLVFIGSFAPVIFFFTTGFGTGIGKRDLDLAQFGSTLLKAGLLVFADQFFFWHNGDALGMDFLGFIALSSVVVALVGAAPRPALTAGVLLLLTLVLRFVVGAVLRDRVADNAFLEWLLGVGAVHNMSYPFSPWVSYPLLGFLLGRYWSAPRAGAPSLPWRALAAVGAACFVLAAGMYFRHMIFFRWGSMSLAFYVLSLGAVATCLAIAWGIEARAPRFGQTFAVRGIASLAVVPIHYGLIHLAYRLFGYQHAVPIMLGAMVACVLLALVVSRGFAASLGHGPTVAPLGLIFAAAAGTACLAAYLCLTLPPGSDLVFALFVAGQLSVTVLMAVRDQWASRRRLAARAPLPPATRNPA